jgi:hypothetical protein
MDPLRVLTGLAVLLATLWLAARVAALPVWAVPPAGAGPSSSPVVLAHPGLTIDQAVRMVEKHYRARVVRRETRQEDGRLVYVMRLLSDSGHVWTVRVDAASGSIR